MDAITPAPVAKKSNVLDTMHSIFAECKTECIKPVAWHLTERCYEALRAELAGTYPVSAMDVDRVCNLPVIVDVCRIGQTSHLATTDEELPRVWLGWDDPLRVSKSVKAGA